MSGGDIFVDGGKPVALKDNPTKNDLYPRTAVAIDKSGEKLWLIIVDGRQTKYSEGMTLPELTEIVMELGADTALNLDGGGSTALVVGDSGGTRCCCSSRYANAQFTNSHPHPHTSASRCQLLGILCATEKLARSPLNLFLTTWV